MTWPTTSAGTTHLDDDADSPLSARPDLLQAVQNVNAIKDHVSAFAQTLLDDADAATARATLGAAATGSGLSQFAATSSDNLRGVISDETGTGALVFANSPTLITPTLGTPAGGTLTSCTGLPISTGVSGLASGVATFLATPSSANLKAALTDELGSASGKAQFAEGTLAITSGKTLTASNTLTLAGTDGTTMTFPSATGTVVTLAATQTLTNKTITGGTTNPTTLQEGSVAAVVQTDIGTAPNEIPLNQYLGEMAYMNADQIVIHPVASVAPIGIGDMVFQLTNDTTLVIKVKGSDGVVRSNTLTLA